MIRAGIAHPLCVFLAILLAAPYGFGQTPPAPVASAAMPSAVPTTSGTRLTIGILEGSNAVNSISLVSSVALAIEVKDSNDYPVEDASVTFTLPVQGPGGVFPQGGGTFSTRSDARGQAIAPAIVPAGVGKFRIVVTATAGDRKGEAVVSQTNSEGSYFGPALPPRAWYKRKIFWALAGGAVAAIIVVVVLHNSSSKTVVVTPGTPVIVP
jgi:hypothetical protein